MSDPYREADEARDEPEERERTGPGIFEDDPAVFRAPSGMRLRMRPLGGHDMVALARSQNDRSNDGGTALVVGRQVVEVVDPGPYRFVERGGSKVDWSRVLKGDGLAGLIFLRVISSEDEDVYRFPVKCTGCGNVFEVPFDLRKELELYYLSEEAQRHLSTGEALRTEVAGPAVRYDLATFAQEDAMIRFIRQQARRENDERRARGVASSEGTLRKITAVDTVAAQIRSIDGVESSTYPQRWNWVADLPSKIVQRLRTEFDSQECGVETTTDVRCPVPLCGATREVFIPFESPSFFQSQRVVRRRAPSGATSA